MSKPFHFKRFSVAQDRCAMKVGTDGVLLGAWAKYPSKVCNVLDIGSGTGVIALMLAQRFSKAEVTGIDIVADAVLQASENFTNSIFTERLHAVHTDFMDFETSSKFDCIVSNPPFFTNGIVSPNEERKLARHAINFSFSKLFHKVANLLAAEGIFSMIIPIELKEEMLRESRLNGLFCNAICTVYPNFTKPPKRILLAFSLVQTEIKKEQLVIETEVRHQYMEEYKTLLKDFYLAF